MRAAWLVPLAAVAGLLAGPASSPATTTCSVNGPAWTVYPAHGSAVYHGTRYRVVADHLSCSTAKGYVKTLFRRNPAWPYAGSGPSTLKGAPPDWLCRSSVESRRNRRARTGDCLRGTGPTDLQHFSWGPKMPRV